MKRAKKSVISGEDAIRFLEELKKEETVPNPKKQKLLRECHEIFLKFKPVNAPDLKPDVQPVEIDPRILLLIILLVIFYGLVMFAFGYAIASGICLQTVVLT